MSSRWLKQLGKWGLLSGAALLGLSGSPASAQVEQASGWKRTAPAVQCYPPPGCLPSTPTEPAPPTMPPTMPPTTPIDTPPAPEFAALGAGSEGGENFSAVNYIDSAIPRTQFRLRFDAMYNNNVPDRGEFFYPKCGCYQFAPPPLRDLGARGPLTGETRVDAQELRSYLEVAPTDRFSVFGEIPVRWINGEVGGNTSGLSDIDVGFKYAAIRDCNHVLTFQMRMYIETGDGKKGLGTDHMSYEPAILYYRRLGERTFLEAEVRDWIAVGGSDFQGNVLRYGVGVSHLLYNSDNFRLQPVAEVVAWNFLSGKESDPVSQLPVNAAGDYIVNGKVGLRFGFGELAQPGFLSQSDFAVSYGRALTGEVLYKDIVRFEMRLRY